jgi:hypothetical protein
MTKKQIHTIILQEEKISSLTDKLKTSESGNRESWLMVQKLQRKIDKLEKAENKLARVNV